MKEGEERNARRRTWPGSKRRFRAGELRARGPAETCADGICMYADRRRAAGGDYNARSKGSQIPKSPILVERKDRKQDASFVKSVR